MLNSTDLIETADAARILGLTPNSVRMYAKAGQLRPAVVTPRGQRLFLRADVETFSRWRVARAQDRAGRAAGNLGAGADTADVTDPPEGRTGNVPTKGGR